MLSQFRYSVGTLKVLVKLVIKWWSFDEDAMKNYYIKALFSHLMSLTCSTLNPHLYSNELFGGFLSWTHEYVIDASLNST